MHKVEVVGPAQKSLIPSAASAAVSIRIVPDQSLADIISKFKAHLMATFATLRTENKLTVRFFFSRLRRRLFSRLTFYRFSPQVEITQTADWVSCCLSLPAQYR